MVKRGLLFLVFVAFVTVGVFSQVWSDSSVLNVSYSFSANSLSILPISAGMDLKLHNENNLYNMPFILSPFSAGNAWRAEDNKWTAFAVNLLVGFGVGSFIQGDTTGGIVGLSGELGGLILIIIGASATTTVTSYYGHSSTVADPNNGLIAVGSIIVGATRIFEVIRPFTFANSFSLAFNPNIDANGHPSLTAVAKFLF